tara:strand:- start:308 stop:547 length:240 start_codon:yes stop_codon:yes gene_type:complete
VKNFWPHRSDAKGFSIQNLARKYRLNISSVSPREISNKRLDNKNLIMMTEDSKEISIVNISIKKTHWANRDFSEYKEVA